MEKTLLAGIETESNDTECAQVEAAIGGDARAFAALYDRHLDRVYSYVYYWVRNKADTEDLTQQVFLNAWRAIGSYRRTKASFISWLLRIAHNLVMSFYRKTKEAPCLDVEPVSIERWADPEAEVFAKLDGQAVRIAILRLKREQQEVVVMRFLQGLDYSEIAAALGKSEGNIRVIQYRALTELRRLLAHEVNV